MSVFIGLGVVVGSCAALITVAWVRALIGFPRLERTICEQKRAAWASSARTKTGETA